MPDGTYSFDRKTERRGTGAMKWDTLKERFGSEDLLPLWVADMDFNAPQPVIDALVSRASHGIYGYTSFKPSYFTAILNWYQRRYGWKLEREWFAYSPGVVPAINFAVQGFTSPGDMVIVQPPVYYPFYEAIESNGRQALYNPLKLVNGRYEMDFEDLEEKARNPRAKMIILCSPHNPVGRVWNREELQRLGEICLDNGILVVADEIHSDLMLPGARFTNFATISERFAQISITCTSASKTFNLAGLQISNIIIPNRKLRQIFEDTAGTSWAKRPNAFAAEAVEAAYDRCEDWLDSLIEYIAGNLAFLKEYVRDNIPGVTVIEPEGTYLCWMDFRGIEPDPVKLERLMLDSAKVAMDEGYIFRMGGEGFERINLACPREILKQALSQIAEAVRNYRKA